MSGSVLVAIEAGPDPEHARARWERFRDLGGVAPADPEAVRLLAALLASGTFLPELLLADVGAFGDLAADPWLGRAKPATVIAAEVEMATRGAGDFDDFKRRLRLVRRREMLRLGARELGWGTTEEVAAELSAFADAALDAAHGYCDAALRRELGEPTSDGPGEAPPSFVVLAMGKQGGEELNFSSDIDVIYFYSTDAGSVVRRDRDGNPVGDGKSLHQYYGELSRRITEAIEEPTAEGFLFRVDLRLRPEGRGGPLCNSLAGAERYYETFGRTWERQALLRARPCAGDLALGRELLEVLDPFIYPRHIAPGMVDEIRALRGQYRPKREGGSEGWNVKLGSGGIRDVEMVVQTLQLVHAGKRRDLRGRSTPRGLRRMQVAGLLTDREARTLAGAYRFWRMLEHRLQLQDGAQTHLVPGEPEARAVVSRRLGFPTLDDFDAFVAARRAEVTEIANSFDDPEPDLPARILRLLGSALERSEVQDLLAHLGFADLEGSADLIEMFRGRLAPSLIAEAATSPDPDRALAHFRDLTVRGSLGMLTLLRDDPQRLRMVATLFGVSERLSRLLLTHPEMWDPLVDGLGEPERPLAALDTALGRRLSEVDAHLTAAAAEAGVDPDEREEAIAREMRRFAAEETVRIGLHDVAGNLTAGEVARQLTALAETCLRSGVAGILATAAARYGVPSTSLTVLGLGSLGAREMRYGSDLDLVFLYGAEGQTTTGVGHQEFFAKLARRVINSFGALLEQGRLYSIDTRLRPSGEQGLLVTSQAAFERYHQNEAASWERVALLRARVVFSTADATEGAAFERLLERMTYHRPFQAEAFVADMRAVRAKVESERGKVRAGSRHLRFDPGGIMDVEFLSALGQLEHGASDPALRTTETNAVLARLVERGAPETLLADYALLRTMSMRMRLLLDRPEDVISPSDVAPLARSLERDPARLGGDIDAAMRRVRALFESRF